MNSAKIYIINIFLLFIPATRFFRLKSRLYRWAGAVIGENVRIVSSARIYTTGCICIGDNTWIGHDVLIIGGNALVKIGANCDIAPRVAFITGTHKINPLGPHVAGEGYSLPIIVGNGSWIGAGALMLGGATIGERSIVAAGAVVKGVFSNSVLIGGTPAHIIKDRLN
jgi:acetyltransferase-like isoleucine patch superfamily enzyme